MHSKIFQLSRTPVSTQDFITPSSIPEYFTCSIADYTDDCNEYRTENHQWLADYSVRTRTVTRKDGTSRTYYEARITVGRDPVTGKPKQRSFTGKTQAEAVEKMQKAQHELLEGTYIEPSKITLKDWLEIWLRDYQGDKKYGTTKNYRAECKAHIIPMIGDVPLKKLSSIQIQRFYNKLQSDGKKVPKKNERGKKVIRYGKTVYETVPLSAKTIKNVHGILTKALSVAVNNGLIRENPCNNAVLPRVVKKEMVTFNDDQIRIFLEKLDTTFNDEYAPLFKTILFTGMRESEALGLTWDCVNFDKGYITISKQLQKRPQDAGGFTFETPKNDKTRTIKPAEYVMRLLADVKAKQMEQRKIVGEAWEDKRPPEKALVFTNAIGGHLHPQTTVRHYKKVVQDMGIPEIRVHDLRHTFAVVSLENGDDIKTVQEHLGHATAAFTLDVYGHMSERMQNESASRMEKFISGLNQK